MLTIQKRIRKRDVIILTTKNASTAKKIKIMKVLNIILKNSKRIVHIRNHAQNVYLHRREKPSLSIKHARSICHIHKLNVMHAWLQQFLWENKIILMLKKLLFAHPQFIESQIPNSLVFYQDLKKRELFMWKMFIFLKDKSQNLDILILISWETTFRFFNTLERDRLA